MADLESLAQALGSDPFYQGVTSEFQQDIQHNPWLKTNDWISNQENPFANENPYTNESYSERTDRFHKYFKSAKDKGWDDAKATDYATKAIKSDLKKPSKTNEVLFQLAQALGGGLTYGLGKKSAQKELVGDLNALGNTYSKSVASQYGGQPQEFNYENPVEAKAALDYMREQQGLKQQILPDILKSNPRLAQQYYQQSFGGMGGGDAGFSGSPSFGGQQSPSLFGNEVKSIDQNIEDFAQELIGQGVTPNAAYERAAQRYKSLLTQDDRSVKKVEELTKKTQDVDAMLASAQSYIQNAGDTGGMGGTGAGIQNLYAAAFQPQKNIATKNMDALGAQFMAMNRVAGTGSVSDFEAKQYLRAGVSSANEPETNKEIIRKMGYLNELDKQYADFLETYKGDKGTLEGADSIWRKYVQDNPALVKDQSGNFVENAKRPDWKTWIQGQKQNRVQSYSGSNNPLTQAQIHVESRGNPNAVSPKGATGLMQIMPETARDILKEWGQPNISDEQLNQILRNPEANVKMGEYYRDVMLPKIIGTNDPQALMQAYNAGPGAYQKYGGNVPYQETQNYVPQVMAQMQGQDNDPLGLRR
jgi:soluble lytic murein transglycosylase-like protein